jgi:hypothetical protein
MQASIELPDALLQQLETLARREGATTGDLIRRIVEDHLAHNQAPATRSMTVSLPLIPASDTGPIGPVTGQDVDRLLLDDFTA